MSNQSTHIEVGNKADRIKGSSLALRIRRAAQLATRAKTQNAQNAQTARASAEGGTSAAPGETRKAAKPGPAKPRKEGESVNVFQRYLRSLKAAEVLPTEEEHRLAIRYRDTGDADAAARLVRGNLRLVVKIAEEYGRSEDQLMDLIQEGNLGLLHALGKFDPERGVKLSSYAAWWIRAYILKFVLANFRVVRLGTTLAQRKLFYKLRRERERLERDGSEVNVNQLAEALDVRPNDVAEMEMRLAAPEVSLDAPVRVDSERPSPSTTLASGDPADRPDVMLESDEFKQRLKRAIESFGQQLSGRERQIFAERLVSEQPLTLQELGRRYGVSRERARQLESRLKEKIRLHLEAEFADAQVLRETA